MIEIIFTRPLTIYDSSEPMNSALFSRGKPLPSPWLVKSNSFNFDWKRCSTSKGCICSKNDSLLSVFSKAAFFSFSFFSSDDQLLSIMCGRVFKNTIILLGLVGCEMVITNSVLRLVGYISFHTQRALVE